MVRRKPTRTHQKPIRTHQELTRGPPGMDQNDVTLMDSWWILIGCWWVLVVSHCIKPNEIFLIYFSGNHQEPTKSQSEPTKIPPGINQDHTILVDSWWVLISSWSVLGRFWSVLVCSRFIKRVLWSLTVSTATGISILLSNKYEQSYHLSIAVKLVTYPLSPSDVQTGSI